MISRDFTYAVHDDYGSPGWKPVNMPLADPLGGMAVAHDTLEHFPNDKGDAEGEFQALGAMFWIRGQGHYWDSYYPMQLNRNPGIHAGADIAEVIRHVLYESHRLARPQSLGSKLNDEQAEGWIQDAISSYKDNLKDEFPDDRRAAGNKDVLQAIREHMRRGYRLAHKRYNSKIDPYNLCSLFHDIETKTEAMLRYAEYGQILRVSVSLPERRTIIGTFYEEYDD